MQSTHQQRLIDGLRVIPQGWVLSPDKDKRGYIDNWESITLDHADIIGHIESGRANGYSLILGERSFHNDQAFLLALDFDGIGTDDLAVELNGGQPLPDTVAWTSGIEGHHQRLYAVPMDYSGELDGKRVWKLENKSKLEARYNGHKSTLPPSYHPTTKQSYQWITPPSVISGCEISISKIPYAPQWIIDALLIDKRDSAADGKRINDPISDREWGLEYMGAILEGYPSDDYDEWIRIGMALKSVADDAFEVWDAWSAKSSEYPGSGKASRKWAGFKPRQNLIAVLGYFAKKAGWKAKPKESAEIEQVGKSEKAKIITYDHKTGKPVEERIAEDDDGGKGKRTSMRRIYCFLKDDVKLQVRLNELTGQVETFDGEEVDPEKLQRHLEARVGFIRTDAGDKKVNLNPFTAYVQALTAIGEDRKYHPIQDYLNGCLGTHGDRLNQGIFKDLLTQGLGLEENPLYESFLTKFFIAAVSRAFKPGQLVRSILVFQGDQESGKTSFFQEMASDAWFTSSMTNLSRDSRMLIANYWMVELAELERFTGVNKPDGDFKNFITQLHDDYRDPYGRRIQRKPRNCIFAGTVNRVDFLKDPTGSTRFWIISGIKKIDIDWVRAHRDEIWAMAVSLYNSGTSWELSVAEKAASKLSNELFETEDPWKTTIQHYIEPMIDSENGVTVGEVLDGAIKVEKAKQTKSEEMRVASIMQSLGGQKKKITRRTDKTRVKAWVKQEESKGDPPDPTVQRQVDHTQSLAPQRIDPPDPPDPPFLIKGGGIEGEGQVAPDQLHNLYAKRIFGGSGGSHLPQPHIQQAIPGDPPPSKKVIHPFEADHLRVGLHYWVDELKAPGICTRVDLDTEKAEIFFDDFEKWGLKDISKWIPFTSLHPYQEDVAS